MRFFFFKKKSPYKKRRVFSGLTKPVKPQSVKVYNDESKQVFHSFAATEIEIYFENSR